MYYRNERHHIAYNETTPIQTVCFAGIRSVFALISVSKLQFVIVNCILFVLLRSARVD